MITAFGIPKLTTVGQQQHSTGRKKNVRGKVAVFGVPGGVGEQGGHNQDTTHIKLSRHLIKTLFGNELTTAAGLPTQDEASPNFSMD